jgi:hypothetical protein
VVGSASGISIMPGVLPRAHERCFWLGEGFRIVLVLAIRKGAWLI